MRHLLGACLAWGCGRVAFDPLDGRAPVPGGDGGATADALVTTNSVCPQQLLFADDFTNATALPFWTTFSGMNMTATQGSGYLNLAFGAGNAKGQAGYQQVTATDYAESCILAELEMIPNNGATTQMFVTAGSLSLGFNLINSVLVASHSGGVIATPVYDPVAHKFLRLRAHAGTWYVDVSPDDGMYTNLGTAPFDVISNPSSLTIQIDSNVGAVQDGGQAHYRNVRFFVQ